MKKRNIVILSRYNPWRSGGLENVVRTQIRAISQITFPGLKICVIFRGREENKKNIDLIKNDICAIHIKEKIPLSVVVGDILYAMQMYLAALNVNGDILIDNFEFTFLYKSLKNNLKTFVVRVSHGTPDYLDSYSGIKFLFTKILKLIILKPSCIISSRIADMNIAVSSKVKRELVNTYRVPPEKILVIPNGIDVNRFKPRDKVFARRILNLPVNKKIILFVGGDLERKGFWKSFEIVQQLRKQIEDILFVVVTSEKYKKYLKKLNKEWLIVLTGIPSDKMPYIYNAADLLVLPSKYEGLPLTLLEALASGCPAVVSPNSAEEEYDGIGYIIASRINEYIESCKRLLQDISYYNTMSKKARKLAVARYNITKQEERYKKLILDLLCSGGQDAG